MKRYRLQGTMHRTHAINKSAAQGWMKKYRLQADVPKVRSGARCGHNG